MRYAFSVCVVLLFLGWATKDKPIGRLFVGIAWLPLGAFLGGIFLSHQGSEVDGILNAFFNICVGAALTAVTAVLLPVPKGSPRFLLGLGGWSVAAVGYLVLEHLDSAG
jgi:hypothetical protein